MNREAEYTDADIAMLREMSISPKRQSRINWHPLIGGIITLAVSTGLWFLLIYSILFVKGWLRP